MQNQNLGEYEFIRKELSELRNCITTYMGFVIGGSGIAFFGTLAFTETDKLGESAVFAFFVTSIIVSLVLMILFYKFNSYNRYAGYCKLLNQEKYDSKIKGEQFISWEVCIDILREAGNKPDLLLKKSESITNIGIPKNVREEITKIYKKEFFLSRLGKGIWLLIRTIFGQGRTKSWNFPLYVVSVFFIINILHLAFGLYYYLAVPLDKNVSVYIVFAIQLYIWGQYFIKLYDLMEGRATLEAYCWRFLPIRYDYITQQNPDINYSLITLK